MINKDDYRIDKWEYFPVKGGKPDLEDPLDSESFWEDDRGKLFYKEKPFSGFEIVYYANGNKQSETSYFNGLMEGLDLGWYPDGKKWREFYYKENYVIKKKVWHHNGQLKIEGENEFGISLWEKEWDEKGNLIKDYIIAEDTREFKSLAYLRQLKAAAPE